MPFQAPRGTEDVLPTDSHAWVWLEQRFRALAALYGYKEIRTPTFEDTDLFIRTSGETSDIVSKQMYSFEDKGGRNITLKPEETAPTIRAVIEHNLCPTGTVCRLSYITPIFRYERPQKGRLREAHQVGFELIGSPSVAADAEIIELTMAFYKVLGLEHTVAVVNSLGRHECRARYRDAVLRHASKFLQSQEEEFRAKVQKNPLRLLDSKDPEVQDLMRSAPNILDFLEEESKLRFDQLQCLLSEAGVAYKVDSGIVRGLDYYTETVFEVQSSKLGAQNALCGGGRYDNLIKDLGGPPTPSVGVAMGIERALIVLGEEGLLPEQARPQAYVAYTGDATRREAFRIASELRNSGISTLVDIDGRSLKSQLKQADKAGVARVVLVGDDELAANKVVVRDLSTGEQADMPRDRILLAFGEEE